MTMIQIPDDCAEALNARAAEEGLSLEQWLRKLADDCPPAKPRMTVQEAVDRIRELRKHVKPDPDGLTAVDYIRQDRDR